MIKKYFWIVVLFCCFVFHYLNARDNNKIRINIKDAQDYPIIKNSENPTKPTILIDFIEDLSITQKGWCPTSIFLDKKDNIYVLLWEEGLLKRFDTRGNETLRKEFQKGQAPGEFKNFDADFSPDGRLFVVDGPQRRLTIFNEDFKIEKISKLKLWGGIFRLDSKGNMYFLVMKFLPKTRDRQMLILTKCLPSGKPLHEIYKYEWGVRRDSITGVYHSDAFRTQIKYALDSNDNIYYATSNKYEINIVSPEGKIFKRITKKCKSRKLTKEEIEGFKPEKPNPRFVVDIPKNMPYIADIFVLENDYLLVITFESKESDEFLLGDLFDEKGVYRGKINVPKYYKWNFLLAPSKSRAVYHNKFFYAIESNEEEDIFWVKRYRLAMKTQD